MSLFVVRCGRQHRWMRSSERDEAAPDRVEGEHAWVERSRGWSIEGLRIEIERTGWGGAQQSWREAWMVRCRGWAIRGLHIPHGLRPRACAWIERAKGLRSRVHGLRGRMGWDLVQMDWESTWVYISCSRIQRARVLELENVTGEVPWIVYNKTLYQIMYNLVQRLQQPAAHEVKAMAWSGDEYDK